MTAGDFAKCSTIGAHRAPLQMNDLSICVPTPLIHDLAWTLPPAEVVGLATQRHHANPELLRIAARGSDNRNDVSILQRFASHAGAAESRRPSPLDGPAPDLILAVRRLNMDKRVRIPEEKRDELSFDLYGA